jgi:hypothetical protein
MIAEAVRRQDALPEFATFALRDFDRDEVLHARRLGDRIFLCTADYQTRL